MQMRVVFAYSMLSSSVAYSRRIGHNNLSGGGYWFMLVFDDAHLCKQREVIGQTLTLTLLSDWGKWGNSKSPYIKLGLL